MKRLSILFTLFILFESNCYLQNNHSNEIVIFDSIKNKIPIGIKKLSQEYELFLQKLNQCVQTKDTSLLLSLVADNVEVSQGGGMAGKYFFINQFLKDSTQDAWGYLNDVLHMGGIVEMNDNKETIVFPYQFSNLYHNCSKDIDTIFCMPYCIYFGMAKTIEIYDAPSENSKIIYNLDYPIFVRLNYMSNEKSKFFHLTTMDRKYSGWVYQNKVYCYASRTLMIRKVKNELKIITITPE